ncbi:MAG TPA: ion channel [Acidimicrobiales bacterium]|nr:ion channel [Acidimicrobiales bacterium]
MPPRPPGSLRPLAARQPDRYGALLLFILVDCAVIFILAENSTRRWLPAILIALTAVVGMETSQVSGWWVRPTKVLAVVIVVVAVANAIAGTYTSLAWVSLAQVALLSILVVAIIGGFIRHVRVTLQTVLAVICVYVLFGLIFALLAFGISGVDGDQFFVQTDDPPLADFLYFSFVVLTTLGFGDLTPATYSGKAMVSFQALLGQIFLVTVVSRLVSLYGSSRANKPRSEPDPSSPGAPPG